VARLCNQVDQMEIEKIAQKIAQIIFRQN
jgi:hypothetical protein